MTHPSAELAEFAAQLVYEDIPDNVLRRTEDLMLDCLASTLAGSSARAVQAIAQFADTMGPTSGPSENMVTRRSTSPLFAAMVNAAAAHMVEQDDVHNGSVFHPAAVVFPPAIATAQALGRSGKDLLVACVAGYEVGIRVGEFLGRSHYKVFHTTGTAGTLAAAVAVGRLLNLNNQQMLHALGSAGTQAAGLWEFLRDAADSKQLHTAKAAANGLTAAYLAHDGFTGARRILEGAQGMGAGMSQDADPAKLTDRLGARWTVLETSFKFHASCRHTHPAADALLDIVQINDLSIDDIASVVAHVHQGAIDVLGPVTNPTSVHQSKFSMGTVLGLIAQQRRAGLPEFDAGLDDPVIAAFRSRVSMELDDEVNSAYPRQWIGKVTVQTRDGRRLTARVDEPKGDPGNTLSRAEIEDKALRLGTYRNAASKEESQALIRKVWDLANLQMVGRFVA
ncbi:2-methylcitrate dehydratase [Pollutimonas nitritireducens]|uniref:2-methylcitrate dehydratase n=1 Tax=Pollutimonas nitritireducens TaxID=2045209 RepID=A0A2N4UH66_9BURK|nr:MmgE/PrpD family protein [Pollutimonas nitritireducens]PLC54359.1 2-methylcitrate dehydratase [Pollutimonas nitritireducens]